MGDASAVRLSIAEETTFGTNPGSGFHYMRFTSEDLTLDRSVVESGEIDPTRQPAGSIATSKSVTGGFSTELSLITPAASPGTGFDIPIEGALMSDWSAQVAETSEEIDISNISGGTFDLDDQHVSADAFTSVVEGQWIALANFDVNGLIYAHVVTKNSNASLSCEGVRSGGAAVTAEAGQTDIAISGSYIRIGNTEKSYTLEREYTDLTTPEYSLYTGCWFGGWQRDVSPASLVTERWDLRGKLQDTTTSSGSGTPTAKWATARINATDDIAWLMEGSFESITSERITRVSHNLDNRPRIDLAVGEDGPIDVGIGNPRLTGGFNVFMTDAALIRKFEDRTASKIAYLIDNGTQRQIVTFYNLIYTRASAPARGNDQPVEVLAEFSVEPDSNGFSMQIDRF